jgi:hypothetical protein
VRKILERVSLSTKHRVKLKEKDTIRKAIQAIMDLRSQGKALSFEAVSQRLGIKKKTLDSNRRLGPEIRRLIREAKAQDKKKQFPRTKH